MATQEQVEQIIKLFIGYFDRAPAPGGTNYWTGRFEASAEGPAMTWAEIAESFSVQNETTTLYPLLDSESRDPSQFTKESLQPFLNQVFENVLGRPIQEAGLEYYSNQIISGERTVGEAILDIINGANSGTDKQTIDNKVAVSVDFFEKTNAIEGFVFDDEARAVATDLLKSVTSDPDTVAPAQSKTEEFVDGRAGSTPGVTINLTGNTDLPGGDGGGTDTQGTANADTYAATVEGGGGTLQNSDVIQAEGGLDALNIRVVSSSQTVSPSATSLEKVAVTSQSASSSFILDMSGMEGETELTAIDTSSTAFTAFTNVDSGALIRLENVDGATFVNFKGDRSSSTDDTIDLYVEDSGTSDQSAQFGTVNAAVTAFDESHEIANIETGGATASFLNVQRQALDTLTVTGTQMLFVEDTSTNFSTLKSADASAMTGGGINLDANGATADNFSFMGSDFADTLQLNNGIFDSPNTLSLDGGDGVDMLVVDRFTNLNETAVNATTSFEVLAASSATIGVNAENYTNIDEFVFGGQTGNDNRISISGVTGDDKFVFASNVGRTDEAVRFEGATAGQSLTFELRGDAGSGGEVRIISNTNSGNDTAAVGFGNNNISTVEIISTGSNDAANVIRAVDTGFNHFAFDNQNGPNNFSISGSQALTITAEAGVDLSGSSDESGFSSGVNLNGSGASGVLRLAGSNSDDAIQGGSAADIFYGMGGDDVLTGNGGADQFRFSDNNGTDEIKDFTAGVDKIGLERVDFGNTTASSAGAALSTEDYVENLLAVANLSGADSNKVVELQNAATQNQITQTEVGATNTYLLVFNQTSGKGELWFDNDWSTTTSRSMTAEFDNITELADLVGLTNTDFVEYTF